MGFLFPPPLLAWLESKGCEDIALVAPAAAGGGESQCVEFDLDMGSAPGASTVLCLRMRDPAALSLHDRLVLADYLAAMRPFLEEGVPSGARTWITLPGSTVIEVEHQLRNHLNSLFMNAGVLGLRCEDRSDISSILDQMESDAAGCLDQMRRLFPSPPSPA